MRAFGKVGTYAALSFHRTGVEVSRAHTAN